MAADHAEKHRLALPVVGVRMVTGRTLAAGVLRRHCQPHRHRPTEPSIIDPLAWTQLKRLAPLAGSLNPVDLASRLADLPRCYFIDMNDTVVPLEVSWAYMLKVQSICGETVIVEADHHSSLSRTGMPTGI